jgi:hypothetical protein
MTEQPEDSHRPARELTTKETITAIRKLLSDPDPWTWGNTPMTHPTSPEDTPLTYEADVGPEPEI